MIKDIFIISKKGSVGFQLPSKSLFLTLGLLFMLPASSFAQETADFFKLNCSSCHTIGGGRLTGPDLKNITQRKDKAWLVNFIQDPKAVIDAGDAYALELLKEYKGTLMPTIPGITKLRAEALLNLIEEESKLEKSQFVGVRLSDRPFTQKDIDVGRNIFMGKAPLVNGGPACFSCHTVHGIGGLGGGTLAPDLTTVFERYEGRKTLEAWLSAPATPTMQSVYKNQPLDPEEILPIVAFFQYTLQRNPEDTSTARLNFILFGLGGALIVLVLFDVIWNKRFRAVRRPMVLSKKMESVNE
ncbi:MAG: cytochrome c [Ignavibacteria bacterium]|nr:cytochrome c [Ignavibacteria bacterium]